MGDLREILAPYLVSEWLNYFIISQTVIVLSILILLVVQKLRTEKLQRKKKKLEESYLAAMRNFLANREINIAPPVSRVSYEALTGAAITLLADLPEEEKERIKGFLNELGAVEYYLRLAQSSSWLKRFYAVERLGLLDIAALKGHFIRILHGDRSYPVRVRAIWSLSIIADAEALPIITDALATDISISSKFNEYIYTQIIASFRTRGLTPSFLAFLEDVKNREKTPLSLKRDMIEACGSARLQEAAQLISEYFFRFQDRSEMKITCIRGAGRIEESIGPHLPLSGERSALLEKIITAGLLDEDWRVRAVSAGAIVIRHEQAIPTLRKLLYDPVYYVRVNSGRALARLGEQGLAVLREEANSNDRFVRDNVHFILGS